MKLQYKQQKL